MTYVLPDNTTTTLTAVYVWANNTVNQTMGFGILLMVLAMVFFGAKRYGATTSHAFLASMVTTSMVCGALTIMGVTASWLLTLMLISTMLVYIFTYHN